MSEVEWRLENKLDNVSMAEIELDKISADDNITEWNTLFA